jgi:hypothetical protein
MKIVILAKIRKIAKNNKNSKMMKIVIFYKIINFDKNEILKKF